MWSVFGRHSRLNLHQKLRFQSTTSIYDFSVLLHVLVSVAEKEMMAMSCYRRKNPANR